MNIKMQFVAVLVICGLSFGFFACDHVQEVLGPGDAPIAERDHVWVVDQNGVEVPVPGTWVIVSQTNPNATTEIGDSFTLPPVPMHTLQVSDGTYTDGEGIQWTKVRIVSHAGSSYQFLERVDTSVSPHRLYVVQAVGADGQPTEAYGDYPFDVSGHNVVTREKQ